MPIKGLEKGDGVWGRGKEPFLKKVFPSSPRLPYQPLSGTELISTGIRQYNFTGTQFFLQDFIFTFANGLLMAAA